MIVVDTDILVWILRGKMEIAEQLKTQEFLDSLLLLPLDYRAGREAGSFLNQFKASHNITLADSMMAAATRINAFKLWTLNRKHYPMLDPNDFWELPA